MKISKFMHSIEKDGVVAFYNSLTMETVYIDKSLYDEYIIEYESEKQKSNDVFSTRYYKFLYDNHFLTEIDEDKMLDEIANQVRGKVEIKNMV